MRRWQYTHTNTHTHTHEQYNTAKHNTSANGDGALMPRAHLTDVARRNDRQLEQMLTKKKKQMEKLPESNRRERQTETTIRSFTSPGRAEISEGGTTMALLCCFAWRQPSLEQTFCRASMPILLATNQGNPPRTIT